MIFHRYEFFYCAAEDGTTVLKIKWRNHIFFLAPGFAWGFFYFVYHLFAGSAGGFLFFTGVFLFFTGGFIST
jgi:hypothetical protein